MKQTIALLGRQAELSLAELEAVFGADKLVKYDQQMALLDVPIKSINPDRLGGTQKLIEVHQQIPKSDWQSTSDNTRELFLALTKPTAGKLTLALSGFGLNQTAKQLQKLLFEIKRELKASGRGVRIVNHNQAHLSTAQILHNQLYKANKVELNICCIDDNIYLGRTVWVQNIDAYVKRDFKRPARDAKVGMLPPKLAQIIVNLAIGKSNPNQQTVLDPFCGTGVILQEALLIGCRVYGTDINKRMINYSAKNLAWLIKNKPEYKSKWELQLADATDYIWLNKFTAVACETYLGPPLFEPAKSTNIENIIPPVNELHAKFLKNLSTQIKTGTRLCLAIPAWAKNDSSFWQLPLLDSLEEIGYNRIVFETVKTRDLIYHRPGQAVARQLLVIEKK